MGLENFSSPQGPGAKFVHNSFTIIFSKPIDKSRKVWYNNNVKGRG